MPSAEAQLVSKIQGGIGVLSEHLVDQFAAAGGELRMTAEVSQILAADGRVTGVRLADDEEIAAPDRRSPRWRRT